MSPAADMPLKEPTISAAAGDAEQLERARIDASTRVPVLMFYASAMVRLLIGTLLAGFVSFKLHSADWFSALCRGRPFCRLRAEYFVGSVDVPFSPRGSDLYHAMVFARRVSLVSMALRCRASNALRGPGPGRDAGGGQLVVRE